MKNDLNISFKKGECGLIECIYKRVWPLNALWDHAGSYFSLFHPFFIHLLACCTYLYTAQATIPHVQALAVMETSSSPLCQWFNEQQMQL